MIGLALGLAAAGLAGAIFVATRPPRMRTAGDLRLRRLAEGVFIYRGFFSNSAVLEAPRAALVVDTQVAPRAAKRLRAAIASTVRAGVTHVVNTHYHGDHSGGNAEFSDAEILATDETARFIVERDGERVEYARTFGLEFQEVHATVAPTRTFSGTVTVDVGGARFEAAQIGAGETTDACIVHFPDRAVVACGDAVTTWDYPFLGVPFLDEGLRDDGAWIGVLRKIRSLRPEVLIPGHGPALTNARVIAARLDLLATLYADLLGAVKEEIAHGLPIPEVVARVATRLAHYPERRDLFEHTVSQRFAIYRCINSLLPERRGGGWWHDLRPSVIARADDAAAQRVLDALGPHARSSDVQRSARAAVRAGHRALGISVLERYLDRHPKAASILGLLADTLFDGARRVSPKVDGMEYIAAASASAKAALELDPDEPLALLTLGAAEVFGAMVLAQDVEPGIRKLERALQSGVLDAAQTQKAHFFIGKAHQMELREDDCDRHLRRALPAWARPAYPLLRARLRSTP
jgi:glyoxylase-like metal-dependent hydrolase (beta-lactamase superfamily II)